MSEFGHTGIIGPGFCMDSWGAGPFIIYVVGKQFRFEDSDRFGPSLVKRNGDICSNPYPPERSPFWAAHRAWVKQGRKVKEDRTTCIWQPFKPTFVKIVRRKIVVIERGDPEGETIELTTGMVLTP